MTLGLGFPSSWHLYIFVASACFLTPFKESLFLRCVLCRSVFRFWWYFGAAKDCSIVFKGFFFSFFSLDLALFFLLSAVEIWEDESERIRKPICRAEAPDWDGDFCIEGWRQRTYRSSPCLSNFSLFWWWPRTSCYISFISSSRTTVVFVLGFPFELVIGSSTCDFFFCFLGPFDFAMTLTGFLDATRVIPLDRLDSIISFLWVQEINTILSFNLKSAWEIFVLPIDIRKLDFLLIASQTKRKK